MRRTSVRLALPRLTPIVCSIGATDPTSAAGIGVDLRVLARLGVRAVFVVVAVTAQHSRRVLRVEALPRSIITAQLEAVWHETRPDAIRVGLIPSIKAMRAVFEFVGRLKSTPPIVLDPVIAASAGRRFLGEREIGVLGSYLPLVRLVTPNIMEAQILSGIRIRNLADAEQAAIAIHARGCAALVKGGHLRSARCFDVLAYDGGVKHFEGARLRREMRGSGCVLAAAIAAGLARGRDLITSIHAGRRLVRAALRSARPLGTGRPQFL